MLVCAFQMQFTRSENGSVAYFVFILKWEFKSVFVNSYKSARRTHNEYDKDKSVFPLFHADVIMCESTDSNLY